MSKLKGISLDRDKVQEIWGIKKEGNTFGYIIQLGFRKFRVRLLLVPEIYPGHEPDETREPQALDFSTNFYSADAAKEWVIEHYGELERTHSIFYLAPDENKSKGF